MTNWFWIKVHSGRQLQPTPGEKSPSPLDHRVLLGLESWNPDATGGGLGSAGVGHGRHTGSLRKPRDEVTAGPCEKEPPARLLGSAYHQGAMLLRGTMTTEGQGR